MSKSLKSWLSAVLLLFLFFVCACSGKSGSAGKQKVAEYGVMADYAAEESFAASPALARSSVSYAGSGRDSVSAANGTIQAAGTEGNAGNYEKKIIKTGYIDLQVENLSAAEASVEKWCKDFGGYISSSSTGRSSLSIVAHIPSDKFDEAFAVAGSFGELKNKNVSSRDVSEEFYDLSSRLENKKVLRDRLKGYLKTAKNMQDLLQIENQLNSVLSDIDSMEGSLRRLTGQIDYSQIQINASLPSYTTETGFKWPSWSGALRTFFMVILEFFRNFVFFIFYLVIIGIPVVAFAGLVYYITFGKLGLVKKFFKKLSGGSKKRE